MSVKNNTSPVKQRAGGTLHWLVLLWLFSPFAVFAVPAAPAYSISDFVTCETAKMVAPHNTHVPKAVFQASDDKFYAWMELKEVSGVHSVEIKVFRPDGTYYGKETQIINETNGIASWWRMAAWWRIKDHDPARIPGRWKLELVIDGEPQRSIYFDINSGNPAPADSVQPGLTNSVVSAQAMPSSASADQNVGVCIIEESSDLVHWTPAQTNALPIGLLRNITTVKGGFRLSLSGGDVQKCIVETSTDFKNWMPIQTNNLSRISTLAPSDAAPVAARFYRAVIP